MTTDEPVEAARPRATDWLIVGHGTVGFSLAERVRAAGGSVLIRDDDPRIAPSRHDRIVRVGAHERVIASYVALCVPSSVAQAAGTYVASCVEGAPLVFDWASALPSTKVATAGPDARDWIDVALLDSLDRVVDRPLLAISGTRAAAAEPALKALGFDVAIAGPDVGQAAAVKLTRSLFMKPLEALVVEFRSIATGLDPSGAAWRSVQANLGPTFAEFADVLVSSDVTHAARRTPELSHAVSHAAEHGWTALVASSAAETLARLADHWAETETESNASVDDVLVAARSAFRR